MRWHKRLLGDSRAKAAIAAKALAGTARVIAEGAVRAIAFRIAQRQAHELPHALPLLKRLPGVPQWVVADWRAFVTRYEKTAASFSGILCLAAALDHLR